VLDSPLSAVMIVGCSGADFLVEKMSLTDYLNVCVTTTNELVILILVHHVWLHLQILLIEIDELK